jgi:glutamate--cysteine ligase
MSKPIVSGQSSQALLSRPVKETSRDDLVQLFLSAAKPETQWFLGVEIELFSFDRKTNLPAEHSTISKILEHLGDATGMTQERELNGALVGLKGKGPIISLEPGGQLEYASAPDTSLRRVRQGILDYCGQLKTAGDKENVGFWALGHQPFVDRHTSPKMPKARYERMREYLGKSGTRGLDMMHLTGSVQCAVDFTSEQNLVDKVRTATKISPFLSALVAASPFSNGKPNGYQSMRYEIWLDTDNERSGIWPEMVDDVGLTPSRYLDKAFRTRPMFIIRDGKYLGTDDKPFAWFVENGFEGTTITVADLLDHLTSFFPEVRTKAYVELRGADCLPPKKAAALAGFWRGILDHEPTRKAADERLAKMGYAELKALQPQVSKIGLRADSPAGPVVEVIRDLVDMSYQRMQRDLSDCAECISPLVEQAHSGRSPADELLEVAERSSILEALKLCEI